MKFIKRIFIAAAIFAVVVPQADSFARPVKKTQRVRPIKQVPENQEPTADADIVINTERQKLEQAIIDTEKIKMAATLAINEAKAKLAKANDQLTNDEISRIEAAKIIGEQNYKIEQANKNLAAFTKEAIENVEEAEAQETYSFSFPLNAARIAGTEFLEKIGYKSTAEEKAIAQFTIRELDKQLTNLNREFVQKMLEAITDQDKNKIRQEYNTVKQAIENEIYRQKTITEEVMSTNKKLFWTAVGLAGATVGGALAYQYLGTQVPDATITRMITEKPALTPAELEKESKGSLNELLSGAIVTPSGRVLEPEGVRSDIGSVGQAPTTTPILESTSMPELTPTIAPDSSEPGPRISKLLQSEDIPLDFGTGAQPGESYYEKGKGFVKGLQQYAETPEESAARREEAMKKTASPLLFPVQPPAKQPEAEQPTWADIRQEVSEAGQAVREKAGELGKTTLENVVTAEDLQSVGLSPEAEKQYKKEIIEPAGRTAGETIAKAIEESPSLILQQEQEARLLPIELGTGGMEPSEYEKLVKERASSAEKEGVNILRQATEQQVKDVLPPKEFEEYKWNKFVEASRDQTEVVTKLGKDYRAARNRAEENDDKEKLKFLDDQFKEIEANLDKVNMPGTTAQQRLDGTVQAREEFLNALEEFNNARAQEIVPKTQEQLKEARETQEKQKAKIRQTQENKKKKLAKQPKLHN